MGRGLEGWQDRARDGRHHVPRLDVRRGCASFATTTSSSSTCFRAFCTTLRNSVKGAEHQAAERPTRTTTTSLRSSSTWPSQRCSSTSRTPTTARSREQAVRDDRRDCRGTRREGHQLDGGEPQGLVHVVVSGVPTTRRTPRRRLRPFSALRLWWFEAEVGRHPALPRWCLLAARQGLPGRGAQPPPRAMGTNARRRIRDGARDGLSLRPVCGHGRLHFCNCGHRDRQAHRDPDVPWRCPSSSTSSRASGRGAAGTWRAWTPTSS